MKVFVRMSAVAGWFLALLMQSTAAFVVAPSLHHVAPSSAARSNWRPSLSLRVDKEEKGSNEMLSEKQEKESISSSNEMLSDIQDRLQNFDVSSFTKGIGGSGGSGIDMPDFSSFSIDDISKNAMDGELGKRGETYVVVQVALGICILLGDVPLIGGLVSLVLGPGLLLLGLATIALSLPALGSSLSPWPVPPSSPSASLVTDGLYDKVRHPLYAGLLASCTGISMVTGSAARLALTAILWYVLDKKSNYEEEELAKKYPEYAQYKQQVTGKFFPDGLMESLPWNQEQI